MTHLPALTLSVLRHLQANGIYPILYGSQGVSLYLGAFKKFSDIDLLIEERYLVEDWAFLYDILKKMHFELVDPGEHEFRNKNGNSVAFASERILLRDKIISDLKDVEVVSVDGFSVKTLSPEGFKRAYRFSLQDGYRKDVRGKNDSSILSLLDAHFPV